MVLTHKTLFEIPVTVKIIGDPEKVASKIFDGTVDPKTGKLVIPQAIQVENQVACRLKEYQYVNEVDAPQGLLIVFGVVGTDSKSSVIANFLYEKLKDFKKTNLVINKQQVDINYDLIFKLLEDTRAEN